MKKISKMQNFFTITQKSRLHKAKNAIMWGSQKDW